MLLALMMLELDYYSGNGGDEEDSGRWPLLPLTVHAAEGRENLSAVVE